MKPFARILVSSLALAAGIVAYGATPVAVSLGPTFPEPTDVYGLHLSPIAIGEGPLAVTGLSLGVVDSLVVEFRLRFGMVLNQCAVCKSG